MATQLGIFDVLKMIFVLVVILVCAYYVTKLIAAKATGVSAGGKSFFTIGGVNEESAVLPKIIYRTMVTKDSSLALIEYGGFDYLVAFTSSGVQVIEKRELTEEEVTLRTNSRYMKEQNGFNFSKYMDKYMEKNRESQNDKGVDKD